MRARADARKSGWAAAMAGALALAVPACGNGDNSEAGPTATVPPGAAVTTTTNPYAIPEVIDAAYVNRVLAGLDAAVGEIVRIVVRTRDIPPEVIDRVKAVFLDRDGQNLELAGLQHDLREGLRAYRSNPGNKRSTVTNLLTATPTCLFVQVERDYSQVGVAAEELSTEWIVLKPLDPVQDPKSYNPTPWAFAANGIEPLPDPC